VKRSITCFITRRLKLKVNEQKECGGSTGGAQVPRLQLHPTRSQTAYRRQGHRAVQAEVARAYKPDAGISMEQMAKELASYLRGWKGYFGFCETPSVLENLDQWTRRRLRSVIWKQWKRGTVRFAKLCALGVSKDLAAKTAGSAHGPWRIANSPALNIAFPIAYFDALGVPRLFTGP